MRMNLPAFHSLLTKACVETMRSVDRFRSCPGVVPVWQHQQLSDVNALSKKQPMLAEQMHIRLVLTASE